MRKLFIVLTCLWLPLRMPALADGNNSNSENKKDLKSSATPKSPRGDVCGIPRGPTNSAYLTDMKERFYRNLSDSVFLAHDVVLRFFLTAKGCIRDVSIIESSGRKAVDNACVDAAYCASPLPAPPILRTLLKAPPEAFLYEPDEYGEGVYTFTFRKSPPDQKEQGKKLKKSVYELSLIPNEVLFRYPGLFKADELKASNNKMLVDANPYFLECVRSPWALQYTMSDPPSKNDLLNLSQSIRDKYISLKKVAAQQ